MGKEAAPTLQSPSSRPAAGLVNRACYTAGAVDGVLEGSCKVALQVTGATAETAAGRLAAAVFSAEAWLAERSAHLVTSAYVAAGASTGEGSSRDCLALLHACAATLARAPGKLPAPTILPLSAACCPRHRPVPGLQSSAEHSLDPAPGGRGGSTTGHRVTCALPLFRCEGAGAVAQRLQPCAFRRVPVVAL